MDLQLLSVPELHSMILSLASRVSALEQYVIGLSRGITPGPGMYNYGYAATQSQPTYSWSATATQDTNAATSSIPPSKVVSSTSSAVKVVDPLHIRECTTCHRKFVHAKHRLCNKCARRERKLLRNKQQKTRLSTSSCNSSSELDTQDSDSALQNKVIKVEDGIKPSLQRKRVVEDSGLKTDGTNKKQKRKTRVVLKTPSLPGVALTSDRVVPAVPSRVSLGGPSGARRSGGLVLTSPGDKVRKRKRRSGRKTGVQISPSSSEPEALSIAPSSAQLRPSGSPPSPDFTKLKSDMIILESDESKRSF